MSMGASNHSDQVTSFVNYGSHEGFGAQAQVRKLASPVVSFRVFRSHRSHSVKICLSSVTLVP